MAKAKTQNPGVANSRFERNISKWILGVIAFFFLLMILAQIGVAAGWLDKGPVSSLFDTGKTIFLPIIMLVLGHYFGSRAAQQTSANN